MRTVRRAVFFSLFVFSLGITTNAQQKKTTGKASPNSASILRGKQVYQEACLTCHQADGNGVPMMNPPITKTKWVLGDKKQLITIVLKGMDEVIEIDGQEYHNTMPGHMHLTDQQVADVLTYIRTNFGNKASAVSVNEVKLVRKNLDKLSKS
jgi:mono/diheme cytochrome c family protein